MMNEEPEDDNTILCDKEESTNGKVPKLNSLSPTRVPIEKDFHESKNRDQKLFVLPGECMHSSYPNLEDHFGQSNNESISKVCQSPESMASSTSCAPKLYPKLPFGLEITAGPGSQRTEKENSVKPNLLPSETLLASASYFKSYFLPNQEKRTSESDSADGEDSVKDKVLGLWHNLKYGKLSHQKKINSLYF